MFSIPSILFKALKMHKLGNGRVEETVARVAFLGLPWCLLAG